MLNGRKPSGAVPRAPASLCGRRVVFNEPAKNVLTMDALQRGSGDDLFAGHGHAEIDTSVRALSVVVADILTKYSFEVTVAQNDEPVEAFGADRPHPSFRESVGPRRSNWRLDHPHSLGAEHLVETCGELGVPVSDEELDGAPLVNETTDQIASNLGDERAGRMASHTEDVHFSGRQLDDEEHVELLERHGVHREEVGGQHALRLGTKELRPCRTAPWGGPQAMSAQDPSNRTGRNAYPELAQLTLDSHAPPAPILPTEPNDELDQFVPHRRVTRAS